MVYDTEEWVDMLRVSGVMAMRHYELELYLFECSKVEAEREGKWVTVSREEAERLDAEKARKEFLCSPEDDDSADLLRLAGVAPNQFYFPVSCPCCEDEAYGFIDKGLIESVGVHGMVCLCRRCRRVFHALSATGHKDYVRREKFVNPLIQKKMNEEKRNKDDKECNYVKMFLLFFVYIAVVVLVLAFARGML